MAAAIQPAMWALSFALATSRRQCLLTYWVLLLAVMLPLIHWVSTAHAMPTILVRKGYHLLALGLFLPALLWEPQLLAVSLAIALALLVALEILRLGQVPYIGELLQHSVAVVADQLEGTIVCGESVMLEPSACETGPLAGKLQHSAL